MPPRGRALTRRAADSRCFAALAADASVRQVPRQTNAMRILRLLPCLLLLAGSSSGLGARGPSHAAAVSSPDRAVRQRAYSALRRGLQAGDFESDTIQAFLLAGLEGDRALVHTVQALAGVVPRGAVPQLILALSDTRPAIRRQATHALSAIGPDASAAADALLRLLSDTDPIVRSYAGIALSSVDPEGRLLPTLLSMALSQQEPLRLEALYALDRYEERALPVLPDLLPVLSDSNDDVRYWTTIVVGNFAASESSVASLLANLLREDGCLWVRERAARELWELGLDGHDLSSSVLATLLRALDSDISPAVRRQAALALGSSASLRESHRAAFQRCTEHEAGDLRETCESLLRGPAR